MAINFPASPADGDVYLGYYWDDAKGAWRSQQANSSAVVTSPTKPVSATAGDLWFNSTDGTLYVYYNDGITSQWVEIQANVDNYKTPSQNYIINGAFDIWQRGTSFTLTGASGYQYTSDRWAVRYDGFGTTVVSRQAFTPGAAPVTGYEGSYFMRASSTFDVLEIMQRIEDVRTFAGQTITISFWAKSASAQNISIETERYYGSGGSGTQSSIESGTIPITTSWTRVSKTLNVASLSGKTIGAGSYFGIGTRSAANNALDIWGVQVELGSVATPFRTNASSIQSELAACQRYYQRYIGGVGCGFFGAANSSTGILGSFSLPVIMRTVPGATASGSIWVSDQYLTDQQASSASVSAQQGYNTNGGRIVLSGFSGLTTGRWYSSPAASIGSGYIDFNAEL